MSGHPEKWLAPSILSADFSRLADQVARVEPFSGLIHVDVMDGHFVPNITMGPIVVKALKPHTKLPVDCHLMIEAPDRYVENFASAGADFLSVHQEACPHLHRTIQNIKEHGMKAGVALNPATPIETLDVILNDVDYVLVMSVNPGFGGQKFLPLALDKIRALKRMIRERGLETAVEVDGGVAEDTLPPLLEAGADWFVSGSSIFGRPDPAAAAESLRDLLHA
jgi:ribulose-phosphate 3-epimerase